MKCFKLLSALEKSFYSLNISMLYKEFSVVRSMIYQVSIFSSNPVLTIFETSRKKVLDPNWPYINTFQTILRNVCLSVISKFCLSSPVARPQPTPAFVLLKVIYYPSFRPRLDVSLIQLHFFWIFSYIIIYNSYLNCCVSTKLSLIAYIINTHICTHTDISIWQMWL